MLESRFLPAYLKEPIVAFVTARRLNEYIRHYETLSYPVEEVHRSHLRAKRSINRDSTVTLKFRAHGKDFHIRLKRDLSTFSNNLVIEESRGERRHNPDVSHIYQGNLIGTFFIIFFNILSIICDLFDSDSFARKCTWE